MYQKSDMSGIKSSRLIKCLFVNCRSFYASNVRTSTVDLAYKMYGEENIKNGCPVITHHGLLGSKKNWESVSAKLAKNTSKAVIAVDCRNHGQSPHTRSHTYIELAADLSRLMEKLAIREVVVVGHSMGGRTGMVLALTEPSKVAGLVVVDISPVQSQVINEFLPDLLNTLKNVDFQGKNNVSEAKAAARDKLKATIDRGTLDFVLMNVGKKQDGSIGWTYNLDALTENFPMIASFPKEMHGKVYRGPTLFIGGEHSAYIPPSDLAGIQIYFPVADLKYIPDAGHNVHAQNPTAFIEMVTGFIVKLKK